MVINSDPRPEISTNSDLVILAADGKGEPVAITARQPAFDGDPLYSPDGTLDRLPHPGRGGL